MRWGKTSINRFMAVILIFSLLNAGGYGAVSASGGEPELLPNPGFEETASGMPAEWVLYGGGAGTVSVNEVGGYVREGNRSVKITDPDSAESVGLRSANIPVTPGVSYSASVYSYNTQGVSELYLEYWNGSGARIDVQTAIHSSQNEWGELAITRAAPSGAAYATLLLYLHVTNVGTAYFDDASLRTADANLGFETVSAGKPAGWAELDAGTSIQSVTDTVYSGTYAVRLDDPSAVYSAGLRSAKLPVESGKLYEASVYSYNLSGESQLYLEYWDSTNARIGVSIGTNSDDHRWSQTVIQQPAPAGAVYATLLLYLHGTNVGSSYFDEASFGLAPPDPVREFPLVAADHPRLYFTDASLPAVRANAANAVDVFFGKTGKQLWDELEGTANGYLTETSFPITYYGGHIVTYPLPPEQPSPMPNPPGFNEGVYPYWTLMSRAVEMRLETLSLAYAVTEDEDYADKAKAYMLAVAEWDTWTDPTYSCAGTTCLDTAHLTFGVSMAYDILYDLLTEPERAAVRAALDAKGLAPLYADVKNKFDHNLQMLRASALASGASAVLGELPDAHKYLTGATDYFQWYLDTRMESGQQEGALYTSYSVDNMIRGLDHLSRVTGLRDYIEHPFFDDFLVRWNNYFLAPGGAGLASFSDSSIANFYSLTMLAVNSWLGSGEAGWYLEETKGGSDTFSQFLFYSPQPPVTEPGSWPRSAVLDEIGWAALRSGWEKEDTLLAFVSNNSRMGHNHYDQNSFQIAVNGSWIAGDPGYQDFTPGAAHDFTVRLGHSTIQVDGMGQSKLGGGSLTTGMLADSYDYVKGSAASAYDNPELTKYDRHIVYVNSDYFVMLDDLQATAEHAYDWVLYNGDLYDFSVDGIQASAGQTYPGSELWFTNGKASLQVKFLGDTPLPMKVDTYPGAESYGYYTKVGSGTEAESHRFLTVLKAKPFQSAGYLQAEDLVPPYATSGKTYSVFNAANRELVFYPADQIGDFITYSVDVDEAGTYSLSTLFIQSPLYGQVQAYVDGQPVGGTYDGYNAIVQAAAPFAHGDVALSAGSHTIQYKVTGKNAGSGNYFIGVDAISLQPAGGQGSGQQPEAIDATLLTGTGATGAEVNRADGSGLTDYVVFKTGGSAYAIAGVAGDADQAVVTAEASGCCSGFSMTKGTTLAFNGVKLLESAQPFNASFAAGQGAALMKGTVETGAAASVSIHSAFVPSVTLNGTPLNAGQFTYDAAEELVTIPLPAGVHKIVLAAAP